MNFETVLCHAMRWKKTILHMKKKNINGNNIKDYIYVFVLKQKKIKLFSIYMMGHLIKPIDTLKSIFLQKWSALMDMPLRVRVFPDCISIEKCLHIYFQHFCNKTVMFNVDPAFSSGSSRGRGCSGPFCG